MASATDISESLTAFGALKAPEAKGPKSQPKERLASGDAGRALIKKVFDGKEHQRRLKQYRAVQDAYDRIPPDSEADLEFDGLNGFSNVNWGGLQTGVDDACESYVNLMAEPEQFCSFHSPVEVKGGPAGLLELSKEHAKMIRNWEDWEDTHQLMIYHMVAFGLGVFYWPNPNSWHFRALHPGNLIFPERAPLSPSQWPWFAIITKHDIPNLIAKLGSEERSAAESKGWNVSALKKAIKTYADSATGGKVEANRDVDAIVHGFDQTGAVPSEMMNSLPGYILYVREHDGSVTEYWLTDQEGVEPIFKRNKRYREMGSVISIFPLGLGDGFLDRVRGYGINSLPFHDLEDRHNNRIIDSTWLATSVGLKGDQEGINRLSELVIGPIFTVPDGMDIAQVAFQNQIKPLLESAAMFEQKRAGRNRALGGPVDVSPGSDPTATGARLRYQEQTGARGGAIARFYRRLSMFYKNLWFRIADPEATETDPGQREARAMIMRAVMKGLPPEVLAGIDQVMAKRIFGDGDPNNLFLALQDLAAFIPKLSAGGQRFFIRHLFNARLRNAPEVEAMLVEPDMDDEETRERQRAQGENADFQTSDVAIAVSGSDNHVIHGGEHLIFAEDTVTQFQNQRIELEQAYQTLSRVREHNLGHLEALSQDKLSEPVYRDQNNRWATIDNAIKRIQQMLGDKRKAEAESQMEEMRNPRPSVKDMETAQTEQLKRQTMQAESAARIQVMKDESRAKIRVMDAEAEFKRRMAEGRQSGDIVSQREIPQGQTAA